jgi:hypothetical protein
MGVGARVCAVLAALMAASCSTPAQERSSEPIHEKDRAPRALPDAYKHPPK